MRCFKNFTKVSSLLLVAFLAISSCKKSTIDQPTTNPPIIVSDADLKALPKDLGGIQTAVYLNNNILYGHYIYTPSGYATNNVSYPLLVFLHGSGELGDSRVDSNALHLLWTHGPPELIHGKKWFPPYPMIVVSPQTTWKHFNVDSIQEFIKYIVSNYRVNTHRIYMTGLSMGGIATYNYLSKYAKSGYVAASVPMSVRFDLSNEPDIPNIVNFPIWTFCGGADDQVAQSINIVDTINQFKPTLKAKLTIFPGIGHDCWDLAYTGSGMGTESINYAPFKMDIYDWMFQYAR